MSEAGGILDGLRDIIAPATPATPDQLPWLVVILAVVLCLIVVLTVWRNYLHPHSRARRLFRQLHHDWPACKPSACGHRLVAILRLYTGKHNLRELTPNVADRQAWATLLEDCDRLRFSTIEDADALIEAVMDRIRLLLWSRT